MAEQTLNVPQLLVFIIVSVLAIRWYLAKPAGRISQPAAGQRRATGISAAHVDRLADMFPQLDRRRIAWDLQRNGGNVNATTERILSGRGLDTPPASFSAPPQRSAPTSRTVNNPVKPSQPDLITRYNLASKLKAPSEPSTSDQPSQPKGWSHDKNERQANLQRRREEMILAARRKLEEKAKSTGTST